MSSVHYVVGAQTPAFIPVADRPLQLGGNTEFLTVEEFQKRFGFVYNDGISVDAKTRIRPFTESVTGDVPASQLKKQIERVLKSPLVNLVLCKMGECGHGVFASKDIPKNSVVAVYAGTIMEGDKVSDAADHALGYYGTNMSFSTRHHRGIASFLQHMPEEPRFADAKTFSHVLKMTGQDVSEDELRLNVELYSTEFDSAKTKELIATENIRREFLEFNKIPLIAMVADKDIKSGDQLGFNYGYQYWLSRNVTPEFFDKNGTTVSCRVYKRIFGRLNFGSFSYTGAYRPLIDSLSQRQASIPVRGDDGKSHEVSAGKLLSLLLPAHACRLEMNPLISQPKIVK